MNEVSGAAAAGAPQHVMQPQHNQAASVKSTGAGNHVPDAGHQHAAGKAAAPAVTQAVDTHL